MDDSTAIERYAKLYSFDKAAYEAAVQAAREAGEDRPKTLSERMGAGYLGHQGRSFSETPIARQRLMESLPIYARIGAIAYVRGEPGNSYTTFLIRFFGPAH